jgi:hypothetical protein
MAGRTRCVIREKYFLHGHDAGKPRVDSEKTSKMQMEYLRFVTPDYAGESVNSAPA